MTARSASVIARAHTALDSRDTWNGGLTWDGGLYWVRCEGQESDGATDSCPAGTYRLQLLLNGQTVGDERVFTLTPAGANNRGDA